MINPYYNPEKLGLEMISFDEPNMSYEYNTLCFWATKKGKVYTASDSGCSCPTPFEDRHARDTRAEVMATLEPVGSVAQAEAIFDSWNKNYEGKKLLPVSAKMKLSKWVAERLTPAPYDPFNL